MGGFYDVRESVIHHRLGLSKASNYVTIIPLLRGSDYEDAIVTQSVRVDTEKYPLTVTVRAMQSCWKETRGSTHFEVLWGMWCKCDN